jgi:hypothetical protein
MGDKTLPQPPTTSPVRSYLFRPAGRRPVGLRRL